MKTLNKNIRREFGRSLARFFSVSALLMLGVFVLIGLNVTGPNMRATAQHDYQKEHLADAKVTSTIGMNTKDRAAVRKLHGIAKVEFGATTDVLLRGGHHAMRVQSMPKSLSRMVLTSGHRPENDRQIVLSSNLRDRYRRGAKVRFKAGKSDGTTGLRDDTYTIVGFAHSSEFLKRDKIGSTNLGNGNLYGFAYVNAAAFTSSRPNIARLSFKHPNGVAYTRKYETHAKSLVDDLQPKLNSRNDQRVASLRKTMRQQITTGETALRNGYGQTKTAQAQLDAAQRTLTPQLQAAQATGNGTLLAQLTAKQAQLTQQQGRLAASTKQLQAIQNKLTAAKLRKKQLKNVDFQIQSRNDYNDGYNNYGEDAQRIDALGKSFPILFFLIAILVSFTTMQRMVEEKRIEMGTLRALGYTKREVMREYIVYSVSTSVTGTIVGSLLGLIALPRIIFRAYTANFNFAVMRLSLHPWLIVLSFVIALASTALASWLAARQQLQIIPADLMLPKPPTNGSRIFLERITPLWQRMSFSYKVTARNLFRYKGRMMMTIVGVAGATALMITGFGIRDSLNTIVQRQFSDISRYDLIAVYNPDANANNVSMVRKRITQSKQVQRATAAYFENVTATRQGDYARQDIALMVPQHPQQLNHYVKLRDYRSGKALRLGNHGAIVSQKLAKLQGVHVGDHFRIADADGTTRSIRVADITTMYAGHDIYMTREYYHQVYGQRLENNAYILQLKHDSPRQVNAFAARFNHHAAAAGTVAAQDSKTTITNVLGNLHNLIMVIILAASLLSLVVLYTLTSINVGERVRELSTLKVLGFYPKEVLMYIYRETNILTAAGIVVGIAGGYGFHAYIMSLLPPANAMVAPGITWSNILISVALTIAFSLVVMALMNRKIQKVDMLEALKSID
ncbi:FtsX-like permease family protein [Lacticaseibacillus pabuli]|uniref:FtsX-like permease family protein n=1 Tax=Lacticaseibacillus pabuli TaxID=3025672 RepID=A0ABY7WXS6_9LACO|nr:FtsX-like permease family protein [Lacticaseibacillus sp. KACC 23028]WDF83767.1 FtsX-like permease family protein [Lacticaseibacillus sp. KACC 23028]